MSLRASGGREAPERLLHVHLGTHVISGEPAVVLATVLGSCVAACIRDPVAGIGGMNHFLLPEVPRHAPGHADDASRFGAVSMERLVNDLLKRGARRERLEAKLFGGAKVIDTSLDIGAANAAFALAYLREEGIAVVASDLGGLRGRKVRYYPASGRAQRLFLRADEARAEAGREAAFKSTLRAAPVDGGIELFD